MEFGTGYLHPMDRSYTASPPTKTNDVGVSIGDIGYSTALGPTPNIPRLGAVMRTGQKVTELTFMGMGKGSGRGHTPDLYGERQRQALREMQKANRYDFTTHASVGIQGLSGMDQQGNFSKQNKQKSIEEIERAIHFAADVTGGGSIVMHTGEFFRHMSDAKWNQNEKWKGKFKMFAGEEDKATFRVIDRRTGAVIDSARKNRAVPRPVWLRYNEENKDLWDKHEGKEFQDEKGNWIRPNQYIDYENNLVKDLGKRVPFFDKDADHFKTVNMTWENFEEEAKEMTKFARDHFRNWNKMSDKEKRASHWFDRIERAIDAGKKEEDIKIRADEAYIIAQLETTEATARGWAYQYGGAFDQDVKRLQRLKEAKTFYKKLEDETDPNKKELLKRQARDRITSDLIPPESKYPTEIIEREIQTIKNSMLQSQEAASSQWSQAENTAEQIRHVQSAETYALEESYEGYAQAGIKAMIESDNLEKLHKKGKKRFKKPLALAIENLFPNNFGGHPDELIEVIQGSREKMAETLKLQGMNASEAVKKAEKHIYATFDTAHMNMWWKHWQGDQDKTFAENKGEFDKWYLEKIEMLAKDNIVGHLHLVDNYGYDDEHLAPGEGNTPVMQALKIFKKHGFDGDIIVEPGADFDVDTSGQQSLLKTWKLLGSPIYGVGSGSGGGRGWGDLSHGYSGQIQPPYFTIRPYAPSEDWSLWSGVPLE